MLKSWTLSMNNGLSSMYVNLIAFAGKHSF
jgi:hypothetical protein